MNELPKKKRKTPNAAAESISSDALTGAKNDTQYFERRYEYCLQEAEQAGENKSQARAWKARALECALYLGTVYTISDGEKAKLWQTRVGKLQASVHRTSLKTLTDQ